MTDTLKDQFARVERMADGGALPADVYGSSAHSWGAFRNDLRALLDALSPPVDDGGGVETTGFIEPLDEKRPAQTTGEWSDVWAKAGGGEGLNELIVFQLAGSLDIRSGSGMWALDAVQDEIRRPVARGFGERDAKALAALLSQLRRVERAFNEARITWDATTDDLLDRAEAAEARVIRLEEALMRLRDCDWTIGIGDRMDPIREIARTALTPDPQALEEDVRPESNGGAEPTVLAGQQTRRSGGEG